MVVLDPSPISENRSRKGRKHVVLYTQEVLAKPHSTGESRKQMVRSWLITAQMVGNINFLAAAVEMLRNPM